MWLGAVPSDPNRRCICFYQSWIRQLVDTSDLGLSPVSAKSGLWSSSGLWVYQFSAVLQKKEGKRQWTQDFPLKAGFLSLHPGCAASLPSAAGWHFWGGCHVTPCWSRGECGGFALEGGGRMKIFSVVSVCMSAWKSLGKCNRYESRRIHRNMWGQISRKRVKNPQNPFRGTYIPNKLSKSVIIFFY